MSVLTDAQREAVDYVLQRSEADSRRVFSKLLKRVKDLGYDEKDLEKYDSNTLLQPNCLNFALIKCSACIVAIT